MLSRKDYKELLKYKKGPIPVSENGLSKQEEFFLTHGLIEPADLTCRTIPGMVIIGEALTYALSDKGKEALSEYEQHIRERVFQVFLVFLGSALTLLVEGLILLLY